MRFTIQDHIVTVDRWDAEAHIANTFLEDSELTGATRDGDIITFTVANGTATYKVVGPSVFHDAILVHLVDSTWSPLEVAT